MSFARLFDTPQFSLPRAERESMLLAELNELTERHRTASSEYARLLQIVYPGRGSAQALPDLPYLPVGLFKTHHLVSVPPEAIFKTLTSSGTTSQTTSAIYLDRDTADLQARALSKIMTSVLGPQRLPMIIVDQRNLLKDRAAFSARGAGVLGMKSFGRDHFSALDDDYRLDVEGLKTFLHQHTNQPLLIFGFTFMVWQYFYRQISGLGLDLSRATLIHSGGWKKLQDEAVDNATFKRALREATGLGRVYNFYGMVEQVGSVFLEGDDGFLYPPNFADVIVRDPLTWEEAATGTPGVIQVVSALPRSYPGHSILTEDLGVVHGVDDGTCGRLGKRFSVLGRVPRAELRGCSDTHAFDAGAAAQ